MSMVTQFWGCSIKGDKPHNENIEEGVFISVTQAVLVKGKEGQPTYVYCQPEGGEKVAIAALRPGTSEVSRIELSFGSHDAPLKFSVEGAGEVHLSGFQSPERGAEDSEIDSEEERMYRSLAEGEEDDESEDEENEKAADDAIAKNALNKMQGKNGGQGQVVLGESDEDEDEDEDEDDEEGSSEEDAPQGKKQPPPQKKANQPPQKKAEGTAPQKRPNETPTSQQQKKQKTDEKTATPSQGKSKPNTPASTPGAFPCKMCSKSFNTERALDQHQKSIKHTAAS